MSRLFALIFLAQFALPLAHAYDRGQWEEVSPEVRAWFKNAMRPDLPTRSCCGEADAYWTDSFDTPPPGYAYTAILTDDRDIPNRPPFPVGTRINVPQSKVKLDQGNPTNHGVIFLGPDGTPICYFPPGGA